MQSMANSCFPSKLLCYLTVMYPKKSGRALFSQRVLQQRLAQTTAVLQMSAERSKTLRLPDADIIWPRRYTGSTPHQ